MTLIEHLEKYLGHLVEGWADSSPTEVAGKNIQVVRFSGVPYEGASTFATLGLSDYVVDLGGDRSVRQEFLFATRDCYPAEQVASFLVTFSSFVRSKQRALLRGDVIGPSTPLISGVAANGLYASNPVIFPEGVGTYSTSSPATVMVWLIPLVGSDSSLVKEVGWNRFEDLLEMQNPDLLDLNRDPLRNI
ncbi:suppressor of fused domain protein [Ralstonia pseudosolanacearum]|uniref:Suppressor of fused domain protein n=1 Tax=Ralstonia solanacearum TaxID=305 RepID=A0AA92Q9U1_RALSL|nr:suppressor of fused domain protein [Ralstonia pseudosolanacearum]QOK90263.1 suppressor of fused domain protein [Ralstonia pseudosolanacearum]QOK95218.1 suppressor of fused domain protein [Ralstonia pseudosolanacearum]UWD91219.1 suppressor of fused domain protein [Ralstonia pseudosolanacearum]